MPALWVAGASALAGIYSSNKQSKGNQSAAAQAAQAGQFRPYTYVGSPFGQTRTITAEEVRSGMQAYRAAGSPATIEQNGVKGFMDPRVGFVPLEEAVFHENSAPVSQGIEFSMDSGNNFLRQVNEASGKSPEELGQAEFQRYLDYSRPRQQRALDAGIAGEIARGTLGSRDGMNGGNPLIESLAAGFADSDYRAWGTSMDRAMQRLDSLQRLASGSWSQAGGIDTLGRTDLTVGAELGGRAQPGQQAGAALQFQAAQDANARTRNSEQALIDFGTNAASTYYGTTNPRSSGTR